MNDWLDDLEEYDEFLYSMQDISKPKKKRHRKNKKEPSGCGGSSLLLYFVIYAALRIIFKI